MTEAGMVRIIIDLDRCNLWTCQRDSRQLKCQMSGIVPAMFASNCRNRSSNLIKTLVGIYPAARSVRGLDGFLFSTNDTSSPQIKGLQLAAGGIEPPTRGL